MPGFEAKSKEIGGKHFSIKPMPWKKNREGLLKILAVVAPSLGEAIARGASVTALLGSSRVASMLGDMLASLPARLDEATTQWFENEFGACTLAKIGDVNVELKLDTDANRAMTFESLGVMAWFEWMALALEVNYGGFFAEALAALGKSAQPSQAPTK